MFPAVVADRRRPRLAADRLLPESRPERRRSPADDRTTTGTPRSGSTSATRGCRSSPATTRRHDASRPARQPRVPPHRHAQPRRRHHPLPPVHARRRSGKRAKLGVFLDIYDIKLTDDSSCSPPTSRRRATSTSRATTKCNGEDAELVGAWRGTASTDTDDGTTSHRLRPTSTSTTTAWCSRSPSFRRAPTSRMPPWAAELPELGAVDTAASVTADDHDAPAGDHGRTGATARRRHRRPA